MENQIFSETLWDQIFAPNQHQSSLPVRNNNLDLANFFVVKMIEQQQRQFVGKWLNS
jgi:hypothetical protein